MDVDGEPHVLLTNDDGIDAPGIRALAAALTDVARVTVVAPDRNQSAVGRSLSYGRTSSTDEESLSLDLAESAFTSHVPHVEHELGYAIDGTPCDCAIVGVNAIEPEPDLVVSGCNSGANLGAYVFSRSGTVSAAMEAAFLETPAIAISMDTLGYEELGPEDFTLAGEIAATFVEAVPGTGLFDRVDYLNVNVPGPDTDPSGIALTRPTEVYEMDAARVDGEFQLTNRLWQQMANRDIPDPEDTDRHALLHEEVSISPMIVPYETVETDSVRNLLEGFFADAF